MKQQMRIKDIEFNDDGWHVDGEGRMFIRSKFTSDKPDRIGDIIARDATKRASEEWRKWGNIRLQHDSSRPIGTLTRIGEPDGLGWNVLEAMIVDAQTKELVRNGVLKAMSVGIIPLDYELIDEDDIDFEKSPLAQISWMPAIKITDYVMVEVSLVDHPMNYDAILQSGEKSYQSIMNKMYTSDFAAIAERVEAHRRDLGIAKGTILFSNLSLLPEEIGFDADAAQWRVAKWASKDGSGDVDKIDWTRYRKAFLWCDPENREEFESYKLQFADVFDGRLKAVWRGLTAASDALQNDHEDVGVPESDIPGVLEHIGRYNSKYDGTPPPNLEEDMAKKLEKLEELPVEAPQEEEEVAAPLEEKAADEELATPEVDAEPATPEVDVEPVEPVAEEKAEPDPEPEPEVSTKEILEAVLALSTQIAESMDKILEGMTQEKSAEVEDEAPEQEAASDAPDIDAVKEEILEAVKKMIAELRQPTARKSTVDTENGDEDTEDYSKMSRSELETSLRERLSKVFPERI